MLKCGVLQKKCEIIFFGTKFIQEFSIMFSDIEFQRFVKSHASSFITYNFSTLIMGGTNSNKLCQEFCPCIAGWF